MPAGSDSPRSPGRPPDPVAHHALVDGPVPPPGAQVLLSEVESQHAVVKRVRSGDPIALHDGRGGVGTGRVVEVVKVGKAWSVRARVERVQRYLPAAPRVELCTALPKGDRLDHLIDQVCQAGAASWRPLITQRAVTDPASLRIDRLRRIADEAMKQSGRAWRLDLLEPVTVAQACAASEPGPAPGEREGTVVFIAHPVPTSEHAPATALAPADAGFSSARVLVGPEGGFTPDEIALARGAGARPLALGPHILRTETAALAACVRLLGDAQSISHPSIE